MNSACVHFRTPENTPKEVRGADVAAKRQDVYIYTVHCHSTVVKSSKPAALNGMHIYKNKGFVLHSRGRHATPHRTYQKSRACDVRI
ncbi:hypothetical protein KL927_004700 [Ogataea polymorpha]|nr:hypothetical protein KL927_004700 [Ogataea polymorpha]